MSIKYFTGCNNITGGGKNQSSDTALDSLGIADTEPADNADGVDLKPNRTVDSATDTQYTRIRRKIYSKTGDTYGKSFANNVGCKPANSNTRVSRIKGGSKYNLGRMWKYRKTLKRLFTDIGFAAQGSSVGIRNMYNGKNNGCVADVKHSKANANDYPMYPMDGNK
jgi:hypothetical protein